MTSVGTLTCLLQVLLQFSFATLLTLLCQAITVRVIFYLIFRKKEKENWTLLILLEVIYFS